MSQGKDETKENNSKEKSNKDETLKDDVPAAGAAEGEEGAAALEVEEGEKKIEIEGMDTIYSATFVMSKEDHTLGNALRHVIAEDDRVELVGYSIPHPLEEKLHFRIQTLRRNPDGSAADFSAVEALKAGLEELKDRSAHMLSVFDTAMEDFRSSRS